jgi:hypothetical protein
MLNCNKSLKFNKLLKKINGLESILCKLYYVSYAQVQWKSYLWLKLSIMESKKKKNRSKKYLKMETSNENQNLSKVPKT